MTSAGTPIEPDPQPSEPPTRLLGVLALAVCVLAPVVAYVGNLGFVPLIAASGLLCLPLWARSRRASIGVAILLALFLWMLATTRWSPVVPTDFHRYKLVEALTLLKLTFELPLYAGFVLAMAGLSGEDARRALRVLAFSLAAIAVITTLEAVTGGQIYLQIKAAIGQPTRADLAARNVARAGYALAVLFWPTALVLWKGPGGRVTTLVLLAGAVAAAVLFDTNAVVAAGLASGVVFAMVRYGGRIGVLACIGGVMAYLALAPLAADLLAAPGVVQEGGDRLSWLARLQIWNHAAHLIEQKPLFGWGMDASRSFAGIPLHPHDAALQLWLELGLVGVALVGLFWGWVFIGVERLQRMDPAVAAAGAASASAYLTIGAPRFGVWQEGWLALGALTFAVVLLLARSRDLPVRGDAPAEAEPEGQPAAA